MTLDESRTVTEIEMQTKSAKAGSWQYRYVGRENKGFENKIASFFDRIRPDMPFLDKVFLSIESENNFPHSSGISSSASFMSSLALSLIDLENQFNKQHPNPDTFLINASEFARLGSGSAARPVYGGYSIWGKCELENSSDNYAIPINELIHPIFHNYKDAILIISSEPKSLSSTSGHALMNQNPYAHKI